MRNRLSLRDFTDPIASQNRDHPTRTGAIVLGLGLLIVVLVVANKVPFLDSQGGYAITADFAKVNNVNNRTPVRVDGVDVGVVNTVGPGPNALRSSAVHMQITQSGLVIHSDASASIRWRTVLGGNMYIDLNPGSPDAPKLSGAIPVSHTSDQVELDDVLRVYDGSTDQEQRNTIAGLSETFSDPSGTDRSIDALPDLTTVGQGLAPYQGTDQGDLSKLVSSTAHTVSKLGASTSSLQQLVDGASQTLGAVDAQHVALGEMLNLSPGTLDATNVTGHRLDVTLGKLDPLVSRLDPGAKLVASTSTALKPALGELQDVLTDAKPLLASARPTFANLDSAANTGVPLLQQLEEPVNRLNSNILPWLAQKSSDTHLLNYESIGPFFSVLDEAAAEYDESGYRLHLSTLVGTASVIDEADLTAGQKAITAECRQVAKPSQIATCGLVSKILTSSLYGGKG